MKQYWTKTELQESWSLSQDEISCLSGKSNNSKLQYALKMKFFDLQGYFPDKIADIPVLAIDYVAIQLSLAPDVSDYNWHSRIAQIHNNEIRQYYGFRKSDQSDLVSIKEFVEAELLPQGLPVSHIMEEVYKFLKKSRIEPSASQKLGRYISGICAEHESRFFASCRQNLRSGNCRMLDKLLEAGHEEIDQTILGFIKLGAGKISIATITEELKKLSYINSTGVLNKQFFDSIPRKLLKKHHDRVATLTPSGLLGISKSSPDKFYGLLACFCKYKGSKIIDSLIEILTRKLKRLESSGKAMIKEELWNYYKGDDKNTLLDNLVNISLAHPDGIIKEKIYPEVGGREKLEQSKLSRQSFKQTCRESEYKYLNALYVHGYRKYILMILGSLKLKANSRNPSPLLKAIDFIIGYQGKEAFKAEYYPSSCLPIALELISPQDLKVIQTQDGRTKKAHYELAILGLLRKELRCKNIWVDSAFKYSDPERDLPQDSKKNKSLHCKMLGLSENVHEEILHLKQDMVKSLKEFNATISTDPEVRIGTKAGKPHIYLTPYESQPEAVNLETLKDEVAYLWPDVSLLNILKEADLRVGLTSELIDIGGKVIMDNSLLQQRLLLALFAMATNTEFNKVCSGIHNISEADLRYVRKRFITPESLRYIIKKLVNSTLATRDKGIWGEVINSFASDSTKFAAWSDNLMTEYHIRYRGYGIMAYWHVDKKALCISSQIMRCGASEIAAMLSGIIHHASNAKVEQHSTDTHGQSLVAFAFAWLLDIDLRPRIKGIGRLKLYKADNNVARSNYCNLENVMTHPIKWQLIIENYDQIIRYVAALKLHTAEPEVLLKRFITDNLQSPLYRSILELGRAVRTIYICRYLSSRELRIEVEEALNVIENWNSGNNFVFFGKRGVISSNDESDQELSILALHLLQSSLVYINTLMLQQVLKTPEWQERLTIEDKRALTPLFYRHINQYGLYRLDMNERIKIEDIYDRS